MKKVLVKVKVYYTQKLLTSSSSLSAEKDENQRGTKVVLPSKEPSANNCGSFSFLLSPFPF